MKNCIACIVIFFCSLLINAQEIPPIQVFTPQIYKGENQNWAISQTSNRTIYIANNAGLLEFNGERWKMYPSPNESIMRSVHVANDRIYSGYYMEFGYWDKNNLGTLEYTSLSKELKTSLIEDEQFWNIITQEDFVLFQSLNRIYIYSFKDKTFSIINSKTNINKMFKVDGSIYFKKNNDGIYRIENGVAVLIINAPEIEDKAIVNIFNSNNNLLIETKEDGFYTLVDGVLKSWEAPVNKELKAISVYSSILLKNGDIALGTISNGIIIISMEGEIKYRINQKNGLSNNTILALFEDLDKNIWLGLDNGINCLNMDSPFRVLNDPNGEVGAVYTAAIYNEVLYLGTNQGLFYRALNCNEPFKFINGTQGQVWSLNEFDNTLFCGHDAGTFVVENNIANKISNIQGAWDIKSIKNMPNVLLQGNYAGLHVLKKENGKWSLSHKIEGFDISSRFFEFVNDTEVLVSHEYKGVVKIKLNNALTKATSINIVPISKGLKSSLSKYNGDVLYAYKEGVFRYNINDKKFIKDSILTNLYDSKSFVSGKLITESNTNKLWGFSNNEISYLSPGKLSNIPEKTSIPLSNDLRNSITGYESILSIDNKNYLLGTTSGYILLNIEKPFKTQKKIEINVVGTKENRNKGAVKIVDKSVEGNFLSSENNIEFLYSIVEYNKYLKAEYQYQLLGKYNAWSQWSTQSTQFFENLPAGNYTFNVRGKVNNNITPNIASYSFTIKRPWHLSNGMIALYILCGIIFLLFINQVYKRYYKRQNAKLLEKKSKELEIRELASKQEAMRLKNDNLTQDIENKNRELAISTMSLIKKNEFLNSIKSELTKIKEPTNVNPVIKIIDKNLNNTDDWKLFQEAFNNADKDFLKKIKAIHPSLTPNDLRLCAYLRLNLSSKEIAPLLNISPRSVEVKRYRLRKKMELSHETSLTNYILEL